MTAVLTPTIRDPVRGLPQVGGWSQPTMALVLALALGAACLALAAAQADPTEATEGRLLALLAGSVVACAGFAAQLGGGKWLPLPAAGSVLVVAVLWLMHQGPQRGGAVVLLLVVTLAAALVRPWPQLGVGAWRGCLGWATSMAVAVQLLVRPELLLPTATGVSARLWIDGLLLPAIYGIGVGLLAGMAGRPALLAGAAFQVAGPGLDAARMAIFGPALLLVVGLLVLWRRSGLRGWTPSRRCEALVGAPLLVAGAAVVVLASYPRLHPEPWAALPGLAQPPRTAAVPLDRGVAVLSPDAPLWRTELASPVAASNLVLDSSLVHGLAATGETVAVVSALDADGDAVGSWPLVGGDHSADWAAERRDVRALEGFRAPPAWSHYVPPGGAFFASRFRARIDLGGSREVAAIELHLASPPAEARAWELHVTRVELRR